MPPKGRRAGGAKAKAKAKAMKTKVEMTDSISQMFANADKDGSGSLSLQEFSRVMAELGTFSRADCQKMMATVDANGDGVLNIEEFVHWCMGEGPYAEAIDSSINKYTKEWYTSVDITTFNLNNRKTETSTIQCKKSLKSKMNIALVDIADPRLQVPEVGTLQEHDAWNISIVVTRRPAAVSAGALKLFHYFAELSDLTLVVKPEDKDKVSTELLPTLTLCTELLEGSLLAHLVTYQRLHWASVVFGRDANNFQRRVLSAATFGRFDGQALHALGHDSFKGAMNCYAKRARVHWYVGNGFEEGEIYPLVEQGMWPNWRTVMKCSTSARASSFAIVTDDVLEGLEFSRDDDMQAESNLNALRCEYMQYLACPPDEDDEYYEEEEDFF